MRTRISIAGKVRTNQAGFTYLMLLAAVIIVGIVAGVANTSTWYLVRSDREAELLFRGQAYMNAIRSYYKAGQGLKTYPRTLDDLLADARFPDHRPHLRRLYADPMARGEDKSWTLIQASDGGIAGVISKSGDEPLKKANFPKDLRHLAGAGSYTEWMFEYKPKSKSSSSTTTPTKILGSPPVLKTN